MNGEKLSREELESLAKMVGLNQTEDLRHQEWLAQRMMRAMAFPEVREAMRQLMEELQRMGMSKDRIQDIQEKIQQNMQGIEQQIKQFAGERIAENLSEQPPSEGVDNLMNRPFHALSDSDKKILQREVKRLAASLLPQHRAGDFAQAMMDLGATICSPKRPACAICPWDRGCAANARATAARRWSR